MKAIIYLLQVSACTGIFYSFYYLLLRRYTFFNLNRWYLLGTLLFSFIIPSLTIPVDTVAPSPVMQPVMFVQQIQTLPQPDEIVVLSRPKVKAEPFDWVVVTEYAYITIAAALTVNLLFTLGFFFCRLGKNKLMQIGHVSVLKGSTKLGNCSFLHVVFINDDDLAPEEMTQIINHEMLHIKLVHSADKLIARIIQIVLWFNPFAYFYICSIEENHEFEVDRIAAGEENKSLYANLLFKLAVSGQSYIFNGFSKAPLKARITMLFHKPTSNMKKIIYLLTLPMVALSCLAFANLKQQPEKNSVAVSEKLTRTPERRQSANETNSFSDTIKYRQTRRGTPEQLKAEAKGRADFEAFKNSDEFKEKRESLNEVLGKTLVYKVINYVKLDKPFFGKDGFIISTNGKNYLLMTGYGQIKALAKLLKAGDVIELKVYLGGYRKELPVEIEPAFIKMDGKEIYRAAEQSPIPKYAFLYEANRVRFTEGQVTNIQKYANGKWKSAVVEVVNGYKIKFNIKPNAPEFNNVAWGDHVTFRFVHELKTGAKEYTVNDWVSLTTNVQDYGIKNPDIFYKFYEKS